jgi:type IV secretory pathway VirB9-like protein
MKTVPFLLFVTVLAGATPPKFVNSAAVEAAPLSKAVELSDRDVVPINTRLRFTTMIVLPKQEVILDFVCGDKEFWVVNGTQNFAFIKPAKPGIQTNLNLITASGNVYSFLVKEVGEGPVDLKLFIEPKSEGMVSAMNGQPRFVPAQAVEDWRQQAELARAAAKKAADDVQVQIAAATTAVRKEKDKALAQYPAALNFDYDFKDQPGFNVSAIYNDGRFTYIKAVPQETPALYEVKDGKPSLVQFQFANGLYTIDKVIDRGYLAMGKKRLHFTREEHR